MTLRRLTGIALTALAAFPTPAAMRIGVNTHFEQGWPRATFGKVSESGADGIRDVVMWDKIERQPGIYDFTEKNSGYVAYACAHSISVLVMVPPRNRRYENGMVPTTDAGRKAFANYIGALVKRFPCVNGVEIGNEINTKSPKWPPPPRKFPAYVALLKEVRRVLDSQKSRVALVGGSSITVDIAFHERMFAAGELYVIDAVAVHPYIATPELLIGQLDRLKQAMARYGKVKPIWCTEFGYYYKTPQAAPPHALKVITMMSAAHVDRAYWYALLDEPWYPNMGLYADDAPKPAFSTFSFAVRHLLSAGDARRIDTGDPLTFVYQFGRGPYVMWGTGRRVTLPPGTQAFDAEGHEIAAPTTLGRAPVIVKTVSSIEKAALQGSEPTLPAPAF